MLRTPLPTVGTLRQVIYTSIRDLTELRLLPTFLANCLQSPVGALAAAKCFFLKSKQLSRNRLAAISSPQYVNSTFHTPLPPVPVPPDCFCDQLSLGSVLPGGLWRGHPCQAGALLCDFGLHLGSQHHRQEGGSSGPAWKGG